MAVGDIETYYREGAWRNRLEGVLDGDFGTPSINRRDAILVGRKEARARKVDHVIRRPDGTVEKRTSHGPNVDDATGSTEA